jgi:hypothetical protein
MPTFADYLRLLIPKRHARWSIGIYRGHDPLSMAPHPGLGGRAAVSVDTLRGMPADGVADPFLVRQGEEWLMFFEIESRQSGRGEIGLARSADALSWRFDGVVLKESFHLSYPHVFEWEGAYYMLPECASTGTLRLYKANAFPYGWTFHAELLRGNLADATPFRHEGRWWILALDGFRGRDALVLFHADRLEGPWLQHDRNPIRDADRQCSRPAGRVFPLGPHLVRLAQDYSQDYGREVRAFAITRLTPGAFEEVALPSSGAPVLGPSGTGWNAAGMHHMDAHQIAPAEWIACVDGKRMGWRWPILARLQARLGRR